MEQGSIGHRKRLRTRFLQNGLNGFLDYEIIELLLTIGIPRKDCKPLAKQLITKFKSVSGVINAPDSELKKFKGLGDTSIIGIKLAREIGIYVDSEKITNNKTDRLDINQIAQWLIKEIGHNKKETFKVICLDTKGNVTSDIVSVGTLNSSIVHPREVFKSAIDSNAAGIVVAHNHPSGNTDPSDDDILTTRKLVEAGKIVGIDVVDHLIVSNTGYNSLKNKGYI